MYLWFRTYLRAAVLACKLHQSRPRDLLFQAKFKVAVPYGTAFSSTHSAEKDWGSHRYSQAGDLRVFFTGKGGGGTHLLAGTMASFIQKEILKHGRQCAQNTDGSHSPKSGAGRLFIAGPAGSTSMCAGVRC